MVAFLNGCFLSFGTKKQMIFEASVSPSAQFPYIRPPPHSGADVKTRPVPMSMQRVGSHSHSGARVFDVFSVLAEQVWGCLANFGNSSRFNLLAERVSSDFGPASISGADAFLQRGRLWITLQKVLAERMFWDPSAASATCPPLVAKRVES